MRPTQSRTENAKPFSRGAGFSFGVRIEVKNLTRETSICAKRTEKLARLILRAEGARSAEIGIFFVGPSFIRALNKKYLLREEATDVLSFDMSAPGKKPRRLVADVVVCVDAARAASKFFGVGFAEELRRYVVHGILHLVGYDDATPHGRRRMWKAQEAFVARGGGALR